MKILPFLMLLIASVSFAETGGMTLQVRSIVYDNGQLVEVPYYGAGVYLDGNHPSGSGIIAARTDEDGVAVLSNLQAGEHTLVLGKWTGSHSIFASDAYTFEIVAGETQSKTISLVTSRASFVAVAEAGWGNALYITGASELLGNWSKAYKMTYTDFGWVFNKALPRGLEYKIVQAPWSGQNEISTDSVVWQAGDNNKIQYVNYLSNYVYPEF